MGRSEEEGDWKGEERRGVGRRGEEKLVRFGEGKEGGIGKREKESGEEREGEKPMDRGEKKKNWGGVDQVNEDRDQGG